MNEEIVKQKEQIDELKNKLFQPAKNQNDLNDKTGLDPKRKIVDNNQPLNQPIENNNDQKPKEDKKSIKNEKRDPIVNLLNKDKSSN